MQVYVSCLIVVIVLGIVFSWWIFLEISLPTFLMWSTTQKGLQEDFQRHFDDYIVPEIPNFVVASSSSLLLRSVMKFFRLTPGSIMALIVSSLWETIILCNFFYLIHSNKKITYLIHSYYSSSFSTLLKCRKWRTKIISWRTDKIWTKGNEWGDSFQAKEAARITYMLNPCCVGDLTMNKTNRGLPFWTFSLLWSMLCLNNSADSSLCAKCCVGTG